MAEPILSPDTLAAAVPPLDGEIRLPGLGAPVQVYRDPLGVAHIRAETDADAFYAQGFVHAQDRLWHMEYDRQRAYGRLAEWVGSAGVDQDRFLRSLNLEENARGDHAAATAETREMLDAYAAGVNAFVVTYAHLPIEYEILGTRPEPWQPWDGLAVFKVRHVTMGVWEAKLWRGRVLHRAGPEVLSALYGVKSENELVIFPPGTRADARLAAPLDALAGQLRNLAWLDEEPGGSNSWVLAGSRTVTGRPLLAGDPHRAPDVPNVYYQNHLAGATFDAVGLCFPGLPGFPHFGHNERVAWCVTHAMADTQDLFVEQFDPANPSRYRYIGGWREAEVRREVIHVRGAEPVEFDAVTTHHGPIVATEPGGDTALAMRYTALLPGNKTWDCLLPMLRARDVDALEEAMRGWVDPANNFLLADVEGTIAYRTRGEVPVRSPLNAWVPVPGWTGEHEWTGPVPFDAMPSQRHPETGFIATANNRIVGPDYPHYLSHWYRADHRARAIVERLSGQEVFSADDLVAIHADVVSRPARQLKELFSGLEGRSPLAARAVAELAGWDGQMRVETAAPLIYAAAREEMVKVILHHALGPLALDPYRTPGGGPASVVIHLRQRLHEHVLSGDTSLLPEGTSWSELAQVALERAVESLRAQYGEDIGAWRWGAAHRLEPFHPLSLGRPELGRWLNPPSREMGGDGDTVQAAGHHPASGYTVTLTSVARYLFDLADWDRSRWIVPYGVSGHPGSPHYADQSSAWHSHELRPMYYGWSVVAAVSESKQTLTPF